MLYRDLIATIARHLPERTQREVAEVLDLLIEIWQDELAQGKTVSLPNLGWLSVEVQNLRIAGAVKDQLGTDAPPIIPRRYGRFRLAKSLKEKLAKDYGTDESS